MCQPDWRNLEVAAISACRRSRLYTVIITGVREVEFGTNVIRILVVFDALFHGRARTAYLYRCVWNSITPRRLHR